MLMKKLTRRVSRTESTGHPNIDERGAVMLESALVLIFYGIIIGFILDAGLVMFRYSTLTTTGENLARHLGIQLGRAISVGGVGGSCTTFLNTAGNTYLQAHAVGGQSFSMTDSAATFKFDASIVPGGGSPYAILRVQGSLSPSCLVCNFFPRAVIRSESSLLVEFSENPCS
ncbi:MAG: hypothetical protein U0136_16450 [Bdellovibrionota bacterium]